jgi:hypothetical protein
MKWLEHVEGMQGTRALVEKAEWKEPVWRKTSIGG